MTDAPSTHENGEGRYCYSIVLHGASVDLGDIGIDDTNVYTVPCREIAAVVHSCNAQPYVTEDNDTAKEWILTHNYVIDQATKQFGTVLPFSFNCIIRGNDDTIPEWLSTDYDSLRAELEKVKDKAEYVVQIFSDQVVLLETISKNDEGLKRTQRDIHTSSKGAAYLRQKQFELKVKDAVSIAIAHLAKEFGSRIQANVDEMKVEKTPSQIPDKYKDMKLVATLSCLVHKGKLEDLSEVLDEINNRRGFAVRFTGPWAPFSFVQLQEV